MKFLKLILFTVIVGSAFSANAYTLSDVRTVNAQTVTGEWLDFRFNLSDYGYNHLTDSITNIKLSFDFREIVDTEENLEDLNDMANWEFVIFYSWIFDGRSIYHDVDTGIVTFNRVWSKSYDCQYYDVNYPEPTCAQNIDLDGIMFSSAAFYTDNLWLGEVRLDAEVYRTPLPEPSPILLFGLGLLGLAAKQSFRDKRFKKNSPEPMLK